MVLVEVIIVECVLCIGIVDCCGVEVYVVLDCFDGFVGFCLCCLDVGWGGVGGNGDLDVCEVDFVCFVVGVVE